MTGSMVRIGAADDIAAMEFFVALLQNNVLYRQRWATHKQLKLATNTLIEQTCRRRRQRGLGKLTPIE